MTPVTDGALGGSSIPMMGWLFYGILFVFWALTTALLSRVIKTHDEQQKRVQAELEKNRAEAQAELQKAKDEYRAKLDENNVAHAAHIERLHALELSVAQSATKDALARLESRLEQLHGDMRTLAAEMRSNSRESSGLFRRPGTDPGRDRDGG